MCPWGMCPWGTCPGGFCPVTEGVIVHGVYDNTGDLVDGMFTKFKEARNKLQKIGHRPVVCQLMGIYLFTYNKGVGTMQVECQNAINWGLPHLSVRERNN